MASQWRIVGIVKFHIITGYDLNAVSVKIFSIRGYRLINRHARTRYSYRKKIESSKFSGHAIKLFHRLEEIPISSEKFYCGRVSKYIFLVLGNVKFAHSAQLFSDVNTPLSLNQYFILNLKKIFSWKIFTNQHFQSPPADSLPAKTSQIQTPNQNPTLRSYRKHSR